MGSIVDSGKSDAVEMGIFLGSGEACVSEHFLDGSEVCPGLKQMGGKGVTDGMRRCFFWETKPTPPVLYQSLDLSRVEAILLFGPFLADKKGVVEDDVSYDRFEMFKVFFQGGDRNLT